ncbi:nuclear transport factor 2 family protein [Arthrobacter sp. GCM10027362]|uniref:nuclear transport factor 2 family protein n=1 Tax=Arthrobacter sp. GCM10027362 TaxID=3273379 RepID=UPI003630B5C0
MADPDIARILELEDERFNAVLAKDFDAFARLCHPRLSYTHSNGLRDTLESYVEQCRAGVYDYQRINHPVEEVILVGDTALVVGRMEADLQVNGRPTRLDNGSLAVWTREGGTWKFLAYQPSPRPGTTQSGQQPAKKENKESMVKK